MISLTVASSNSIERDIPSSGCRSSQVRGSRGQGISGMWGAQVQPPSGGPFSGAADSPGREPAVQLGGRMVGKILERDAHVRCQVDLERRGRRSVLPGESIPGGGAGPGFSAGAAIPVWPGTGVGDGAAQHVSSGDVVDCPWAGHSSETPQTSHHRCLALKVSRPARKLKAEAVSVETSATMTRLLPRRYLRLIDT
jgi:hypothetical protein